MRPLHVLGLVGVAAAWGLNFVFVRLGLDGVPPLFLCFLRFLLTAVPAVFFLARPRCSWALLCAFGLVNFGFQFAFLFMGMRLGMSPGLASLLMQFQVFFTLGLAAWLMKEKPSSWRITGAVISSLGVVYIGLRSHGEASWAGFALTLLASLCWSTGSILSKKIATKRPLSLVVWGSLIATPFAFLLCWLLEGPAQAAAALERFSVVSTVSIAYIVCISSFLAYSLWGHFLNLHPSAVVAPFTLLVPVFGFAGSYLFLGEAFPAWKAVAALLVFAGLCFNLLEAPVKRRRRASGMIDP